MNGIIEYLVDGFLKTFVIEDRWKMFLTGFGNTIKIAFFAVILGIVIGIFVAIAKVFHAQTGKMRFFNIILNIYVTLIRGTPMLVQLLIMSFIILKSADGVFVAILAFGINSGAYVSEIVRAGIMAVDRGQTEAGRSLGLTAGMTMKNIVLPQAIKNILPALANEFITLLKDTSIVGYVAIADLTHAASRVQGVTYDPIFPLISIAIVYLIIVIGLTALQKTLERRLARSDRR